VMLDVMTWDRTVSSASNKSATTPRQMVVIMTA
jgi:hypothetical protein